jgi:muramidase (phage lysozyme)
LFIQLHTLKTSLLFVSISHHPKGFLETTYHFNQHGKSTAAGM